MQERQLPIESQPAEVRQAGITGQGWETGERGARASPKLYQRSAPYHHTFSIPRRKLREGSYAEC